MTTQAPAGNTTVNARRKALGLAWYGQTTASLCWMASMFAYGIDGPGDVLQLAAASAWLIANIVTAVTIRKCSVTDS